MAYYTFQHRHPPTTAWWQENLARGVITAGWDGEAGDRGDQVLNQLEEGDWVLAYCNGPGFVGAGRVLARYATSFIRMFPRALCPRISTSARFSGVLSSAMYPMAFGQPRWARTRRGKRRNTSIRPLEKR